MTQENCPVCGEELDEFELIGSKNCHNCSYYKITEERVKFSKSEYLFEIAEILQALIESVKNINTDEELDEIEEEIEKAKKCIEMISKMDVEEEKYISPQDKTFPNPQKRKRGQGRWIRTTDTTGKTNTPQLEEADSQPDSFRLDSLKNILEEKTTND